MEEDYLTPVVASIIGGVLTIASALIVSKLMSRYVNKKLEQLEKEGRLRPLENPES